MLDPKFAKMTHDAAVLASAGGMTSEEAFDKLIESFSNAEERIQRMIDIFMDMQDEWPMLEEGWKAFIRDIEYTNKKHGWNLHIK